MRGRRCDLFPLSQQVITEGDVLSSAEGGSRGDEEVNVRVVEIIDARKSVWC